MFESITATSTIAAATSWVGLVDTVVLLAVGLGLLFMVAGWVTYKLARR